MQACDSLTLMKSFAVVKSRFCRGKESFAVEKKVLPWKRKFCRGKESFAVEKKVLPSKSMFCREKVSFAVADVGQRRHALRPHHFGKYIAFCLKLSLKRSLPMSKPFLVRHIVFVMILSQAVIFLIPWLGPVPKIK